MAIPCSRSLVARLGAVTALALAAVAPGRSAALPLLEAELSLDHGPARLDHGPAAALALAASEAPPAEPAPSLDFDLLGAPPPVAPRADDAVLKRRRSMLEWHQGVGLGLLGLQLATTVVGQLSYLDKFGANAPVTGRYERSHQALAYATVGAFAVNGMIALLTPRAPDQRSEGFDRVTLHKLGMAVATAGMIAQGVLGIYTAQREGFLDQPGLARAHLVIGYATLAAVGVAVGALVL
jgi:hypothetical protein